MADKFLETFKNEISAHSPTKKVRVYDANGTSYYDIESVTTEYDDNGDHIVAIKIDTT